MLDPGTVVSSFSSYHELSSRSISIHLRLREYKKVRSQNSVVAFPGPDGTICSVIRYPSMLT